MTKNKQKKLLEIILKKMREGKKLNWGCLYDYLPGCQGFHGNRIVFYKNRRYYIQQLDGYHCLFENLPDPVRISKEKVVKEIKKRIRDFYRRKEETGENEADFIVYQLSPIDAQ